MTMLDLSLIAFIYLATGKTDLRKGIEGLVTVITEQFDLDSCQSTLFLFCGIRKDRFKRLLWQIGAFCFFCNVSVLKTIIFNNR